MILTSVLTKQGWYTLKERCRNSVENIAFDELERPFKQALYFPVGLPLVLALDNILTNHYELLRT